MMRSILVFSLFIIYSFSAIPGLYSQTKKPVIAFETMSHDFGTFKEENGPVKHQFKFFNKGNAPLLITDVKASCGCTTPDWTKSPVLPGQSGLVSASFDPSKRPGNFDKTITVTSNAEQVTLRITGEVAAKVKTNDDIYPVKYDNISLETSNIGFTKILNTEVKTDTVHVLNTSGENVKLSFEKVPAYIKIKTGSEYIKAKGKGFIIVTFYANVAKYWGFRSDNISVVINGNKNPANFITVTATVEEDFSKLTSEQLANAPVIQFEKKEYSFGNVKQGETVSYDFKFSNTGKSDLFIRDIKTITGLTTKSSAEVIHPGKSASISITFNTLNKKDKQNKIITVVSNDPKNNEIYLKINGFVSAGQK
jgi:hypothetical protein